VTLKTKVLLHLGAVHAAIAGILFWQRMALGWWLFPFEIALIVSFLFSWSWIRSTFVQSEVAHSVANVIAAGDYGSRYPLVGHEEVDAVLSTYNRMLASLQQERFRLGEQRGFAEKFLEDTPIGVLIFDFDERITLANPRARDLLGGCERDALADRSLESLEMPLARMLAALPVGETRMVTDAAGRRLRCRRSQFSDRGFVRSYVLIEELTAELNRSERDTYEKLIRMMSHEVTNTVAATNSLLESCRNYGRELQNAESRSDYENALAVLITRNRSLNDFIRGFSDLVKLPEPQRESADIGEMLKAMQTMFKAELERRNIALELAVAAGVPAVSLDKTQFDQVLINVIKNAIEAIERDGRIEIVAELSGGFVELAVFDSGGGLSEEIRERLFTPFYTTKSHGQGLGLTLVREILAQHGFAFSLESVASRTRFRIRMQGTSVSDAPVSVPPSVEREPRRTI
jgi:nitrogen fixation/metabolism regulation signal transduction histidine kinase